MKNITKILAITISVLTISHSAMAAGGAPAPLPNNQLHSQCTAMANQIAVGVNNILRDYSNEINQSLSGKYNAPFKNPLLVKVVAPILALAEKQLKECRVIPSSLKSFSFGLYGKGGYLVPNTLISPVTKICSKKQICEFTGRIGDNGKKESICKVVESCTFTAIP